MQFIAALQIDLKGHATGDVIRCAPTRIGVSVHGLVGSVACKIGVNAACLNGLTLRDVKGGGGRGDLFVDHLLQYISYKINGSLIHVALRKQDLCRKHSA